MGYLADPKFFLIAKYTLIGASSMRNKNGDVIMVNFRKYFKHFSEK